MFFVTRMNPFWVSFLFFHHNIKRKSLHLFGVCHICEDVALFYWSSVSCFAELCGFLFGKRPVFAWKFFFCSWSGWCSSPWWLNYDVMMWWWCHTLFYFLSLLTCFWSAGQVCVCTEPVIWFSFSLIYCCSSFRTFLFCLEVNRPANLLEFVTRILSEFIFRILLWNKCNHSDTKFFVLH